jgi:hypothetical protein
MNKVFVDRWAVMHRWWSVRVGALGVILMAGIPALSDQFPNIAPSLLAFFPKHGQQWVPIAGAVIAVAARVVSQAEVMNRIHVMFALRNDGDDHHGPQ